MDGMTSPRTPRLQPYHRPGGHHRQRAALFFAGFLAGCTLVGTLTLANRPESVAPPTVPVHNGPVAIYATESRTEDGLTLSAVVVPKQGAEHIPLAVFWRYAQNKETPMEQVDVRDGFAFYQSFMPLDFSEVSEDVTITYLVRDQSGATVAEHHAPVALVFRTEYAATTSLDQVAAVATATETKPVRPTPPKPEAPAKSVFGNPLSGVRFYTDTTSLAARDAAALMAVQDPDADRIQRIATTPSGIWLTAGRTNTAAHIRSIVEASTRAGTVPVFVLYYHPTIQCADFATRKDEYTKNYLARIGEVASALSTARAVVVLEPDATALKPCLYDTAGESNLLAASLRILDKQAPNTRTYLDAGHAVWIAPQEMAERLVRSGIEHADGFSVNVSNYIDTARSTEYGAAISAAVGGKHFVIDTSRSGKGPTATYEWCNARDRALGTVSTTNTGHALVDALLWVKPPGESDGSCSGGPREGSWWREYAVELAKNAGW